jgi:hypothetical protein
MWLWLLASCAVITKQADFDVDLALFDAEDGNGEEADDIPMELKLYDARTDWTLPAYLDVEDWGAMLLADSLLRADGSEGFLAVDVSSYSLDNPGFIELTVSLESDDDRRYLAADPTPVAPPPACTFRVTDTTEPDAMAADLVGCFEAWTDRNGAPPNPIIHIEVTDTDIERYALLVDLSLGTSRPTELLCSGRLGVSDEMREEADNIDLNALELAGYVVAASGAMELVAFQNTYPDTYGDPVVGGHTVVQLPDAGGTFVGQEIAIEDALPPGALVEGVAPIGYFPSREGWQSDSIAALETDEGYIEACWVAIHASDTGEALVRFKLVGDGHYDGRE